jgi:hypothetical protein
MRQVGHLDRIIMEYIPPSDDLDGVIRSCIHSCMPSSSVVPTDHFFVPVSLPYIH